MDVRLKYFSVPLEAGWQSLEFSDAQLSETHSASFTVVLYAKTPQGTAHA